MNNLQAALNYAELGYRVFPLATGTKITLSNTHGCLDATSDPDLIEKWWTACPSFNVGISTDGLCVVDVDGKNNPWLQTAGPGLMAAPIQRSTNGGLHYFFRQNGTNMRNTAGTIANKVDTRADGGYIVGAPSVVAGKPYTWVTELEAFASLPIVPDWIVAALGVKTRISAQYESEKPILSGNRNHALIRFAGGFRRMGLTASEIETALSEVNSNRCQPPLDSDEIRRLAQSAARYEPDLVEERVIYSHFHNMPEKVESVPLAMKERVTLPLAALNPGGFLQEILDYSLATALHPQPALSLAGVIALAGTILGRRVRDKRDTRTNIYCLTVAPSSSGKEHPRVINKNILTAINAAEACGSEGIGSSAGLIAAVERSPCVLLQIDEIAHMLAVASNPKAGHAYKIPAELMKLYSSAKTSWVGEALANKEHVKTIKQPNLCLLGSTTPTQLYDGGITLKTMMDGFMGRMLVFRPEIDRVPESEADLTATAMPFEMVSVLRAWWEYHPGDGNLSEFNPNPDVIPYTLEADAIYKAHRIAIHEKHCLEDASAAAIWSKAKEKVSKLALIHACLKGPPREGIEIEADSIRWAIAVSNYSCRVLLGDADQIVESRNQSNMGYVRSKAVDGMTVRELKRKCRKLTPREMQEAISALEEDGDLQISKTETGGRPTGTITLAGVRNVLAHA